MESSSWLCLSLYTTVLCGVLTLCTMQEERAQGCRVKVDKNNSIVENDFMTLELSVVNQSMITLGFRDSVDCTYFTTRIPWFYPQSRYCFKTKNFGLIPLCVQLCRQSYHDCNTRDLSCRTRLTAFRCHLDESVSWLIL